MSDWYRHHPGRATVKGVEVCEYNREGRPDEKIRVVAHAASLPLAQVMCMIFNRHLDKKSLSDLDLTPGSF